MSKSIHSRLLQLHHASIAHMWHAYAWHKSGTVTCIAVHRLALPLTASPLQASGQMLVRIALVQLMMNSSAAQHSEEAFAASLQQA